MTLDSKGKSKRERDIRNNPGSSRLPNYASLDLQEYRITVWRFNKNALSKMMGAVGEEASQRSGWPLCYVNLKSLVKHRGLVAREDPRNGRGV